ncbi:acetate--CoA ligase family protein [Minwuia sp.]|uniref:acetate--CoA ligase family protein n=1 Tax=Minwuia sp. TaxID=2493630 RepID=UPI003A907364
MSQPRDLSPLINPKSIAVIGASNEPYKFGGRPIRYMIQAPFGGPIYPINPKEDEIQGLKAYKDIRDVGKPIDMCIITIPAPAVLGAVKACAEAGVKSLVIFSSSFAEVGGDGAVWQDEMRKVAEESGMLICGPNCLGMLTPDNWAIGTFSTMFDHGWPVPGGLTIMTQSGAVGAHILVQARDRGLGIRTWVATGNEVDVDIADCIAYGASDAETKVITAYMEGCKNPDRLITALKMAREAGKPVICMKVGSSEVGAAAAATHTASLAGADAIFDAVFKQFGVLRVHSLEEMMDVAAAALVSPLPQGRRLGVVTVSGGAGVMASDEAEKIGLDVPELPQIAQDAVKAAMPYAAARNPVDVTAMATNQFDLLQQGLEAMLEHGKVDMTMVFLSAVGFSDRIMEGLNKIFPEIRAKYPEAIMAVSMLCSDENRRKFEDNGYLVIEEMNRGLRIMEALARIREGFDQGRESDPLPALDADVRIPSKILNEHDAAELLAGVGVPYPEMKVATSADEARAAVQALGGRCVMKILSADIQHKTDIGGVKLNVSEETAADAFEAITAGARQHMPSASVDGVLVAPMAEPGVETIIGVQNDPVFGPTVMFGLGGVFVEVFKDVSFRVAPFGPGEAMRMIRELRSLPLLEGARGTKAVDLVALANMLSRLSVFAAANADRFESIDINPFVARADGGVALDAVIAPKAQNSPVVD